MPKRPTITTATTGHYSTEALNTIFAAIEEAFDNTISRDGSSPNTMLGDIDFNGNDVLNVGRLDVATLVVNNVDLETYIGQSGSTADINAITFSTGDILYFDGTNVVALPLGTAGQALKVNGAGNGLEWAADIDTDNDTVGVNVEENGSSIATDVRTLDFTTTSGTAVSYDSGTNTVTVDLGDIS